MQRLANLLFIPVLTPVSATAGATAGVFRGQGNNNLLWKFTALVATFTMIWTVIVPRVPVTLALFTETVNVGSNAFTTAASFGGPPADVTFASVADNGVKEDKPTTNQGDRAKLEVKTESGQAKTGREFIRFDVSSIPAGSTVSSATLTLCNNRVPGHTRPYDVHRVTASWGEMTQTWNNQPAVAATATDTQNAVDTFPGCMSWMVTANVQLWVDGTTNDGWRISDPDENNTTQWKVRLRSREDTAVSGEEPKLDVTYS